MQIGIVGFPFAGKSTLFQTITNIHIDANSFGKNESHHAVIKVPDERLDVLAQIFSPQKITYASIEIVDVVGLKKGETGSPQFTGKFLSEVKNNDALVQVVRLFDNDVVPHPFKSNDILRDVSYFETEFIISDMSILEARIDRIKKQIQKSGGIELKNELPTLEKAYNFLQNEIPLREANLDNNELAILKNYSLLTLKPMLITLNLGENYRVTEENYIQMLREKKSGTNTKVFSFYGKIEHEMSELQKEDIDIFMAEYNIKESALNKLIREAYDLLGLHSFYTVGEDECRAWTIKKNTTANVAAGVIHSDIMNKFIRAEVVSYNDFIAHGGSFVKLKQNGLLRLEGKDYIVNDGDIITFRHG